MKKYIFIGLLLVAILGFFSLNQEKVYGIVVDENQEAQEEIIELSQGEKDFFDKMKLKQQYEDEGIMVVDTINGTSKETIEIDGVDYEKDALVYMVYKASMNGELDSATKKYENEMSFSNQNRLTEIQEKADQGHLLYDDIEPLFSSDGFIEDEKTFVKDLIPNRIILDSRNYNMMTDYYYTTVYVGYYEDFNEVSTITGTYAIQAEYYFSNNQVIYTGTTRYVLLNFQESYNHINTIQFSYRSYYYPVVNAPLALITVVIDYWGEQKMILSSSDIGENFKITRETHYNRNEYNTINGVPVNELYPTEQDLGNEFGISLDDSFSYFHLLLSQNSDNTKYVKDVQYIDINLNREINGSLELVYDGSGNVLDEETDFLVLYTFNFGVDDSDPENEAVPDAHYIRDVYPYLVWGNTQDDYNSYSAYERFVWDKASVTGNITARNSSGTALTDLYPETIGDCLGTEIPSDFINNPYGWSMYFSFIEDQDLHAGSYSNIDWSTFIINVYTEVPGVVTKFEDEDNVDYDNPGTYTVTVGIRDSENHELTQTFSVLILPRVVVPSC
jgi:hypothetical protein